VGRRIVPFDTCRAARSREYPGDDIGGRASIDERENAYLATSRFDKIRANDIAFSLRGVRIVVASLYKDIRTDHSYQIERSILFENHCMVDRAQGRDQSGAVVLLDDRPLRTLQPTNRRIAVDADDKGIAKRARFLQIGDMPGMQNIEDAIGEDDSAAITAKAVACVDKFGQGE
jgi:hypothetical protein